jgi:hypothetical protein
MTVSMDKKYTSDGKPIRILCTDRPSGECVIGMFPNGQLGYFTCTGYSQDGRSWDLVEVWEPQVNEWCLFYNENANRCMLSKFEKVFDGMFRSTDGCHWKYCYRFDGTLPEQLTEL